MIATIREKLNQLQDMVFSTPLSELAIERSREDRQGKRQVLLNLKWLLSLSLAITVSVADTARSLISLQQTSKGAESWLSSGVGVWGYELLEMEDFRGSFCCPRPWRDRRLSSGPFQPFLSSHSFLFLMLSHQVGSHIGCHINRMDKIHLLSYYGSPESYS